MTIENTFGTLLRRHRRNARDPLHGGPLSQDRLADLLSARSGIVYSRGAVSDWERGKGHIHKDARPVLVALIAVLHEHGGLPSAAAADAWLAAGNYRRLDATEAAAVDPTWTTTADAAQAIGDGNRALFTAPSLPPHQIVGRDDLIATLRSQLAARDTLAITALNGLPGVGKTTLAIQLAHDDAVRARYPDGVLWVGLGRAPDVYHQLGVWAQAVGIPAADLDRLGALRARANAIHDALRHKRMLIVIDDVWDDEPVPLFKVGGPDCLHLLTTRQPRLAHAFAGREALSVPELSAEHALELLRHLAPQAVAHDPAAARDLATATGGLPLALVLIGNHLRLEAATGRRRRVSAALARLRDAGHRLDIAAPQPVLDHEAHPSLSAAGSISLRNIIDVSYAALEPAARAALRAVALFPPKPNTFSEAAAVAVIAPVADAQEAALDALDALSDQGLLESTRDERYALHQSISDFARQPTSADGEAPADGTPSGVIKRFIAYYTGFAAAHVNDHDALLREQDNIAAALRLAASAAPDLLWALCDAVFPFLDAQGQHDLAAHYLDMLGDMPLTPARLARVSERRGLLRYKQGDAAVATAIWRDGLARARAGQAHSAALGLLSHLSMVSSEARDYAAAAAYLAEAAEHARSAGNWREVSRAEANAGRLMIISDRYAAADAYLARSLEVALAHDFATIACAVHNMRGLAAMSLGEREAAVGHYYDGLQLARANRFTDRTLDLLTNLGHLLREMGRLKDAVLYLEEGLALAQRLNNPAKASHLLMDLGLAAAAQGDETVAAERLAQGLAAAEAADNVWLKALIEARWATVEAAAGRPAAAEGRAERALTLAADASNNAEIVGLAQFALAQAALARGRSADAAAALDAGLAALDAAGHGLAVELRAWGEAHLG